MKATNIILLDKDNNALGKANYDRWNKLPWYKRIFGFIYCYKRKFIDLEGFEIIDSIDEAKVHYGTPVTLEELKMHYDYHRIPSEVFIKLIELYAKSKKL